MNCRSRARGRYPDFDGVWARGTPPALNLLLAKFVLLVKSAAVTRRIRQSGIGWRCEFNDKYLQCYQEIVSLVFKQLQNCFLPYHRYEHVFVCIHNAWNTWRTICGRVSKIVIVFIIQRNFEVIYLSTTNRRCLGTISLNLHH